MKKGAFTLAAFCTYLFKERHRTSMRTSYTLYIIIDNLDISQHMIPSTTVPYKLPPTGSLMNYRPTESLNNVNYWFKKKM